MSCLAKWIFEISLVMLRLFTISIKLCFPQSYPRRHPLNLQTSFLKWYFCLLSYFCYHCNVLQINFFKLYNRYCSNHSRALELLTTRMSNRKKLRRFLEVVASYISFFFFFSLSVCGLTSCYLQECSQNKECRSLMLPAFLILPIQRICKYGLFFKVCCSQTHS